MIRSLGRSIKRGRLYPISRWIIEPIGLWRWKSRGYEGPPPDGFKSRLVAGYGKRFQAPILVETGTYLGQMIVATHRRFAKVISIELDPTLFKNAQIRFKNWRNVELILGDSGAVLAERATSWKQNCVFWLDAHYCGPSTAFGEDEAPLIRELGAIFQRSSRLPDVILIDDARKFLEGGGYPQLETVLSYITENRPNWEVKVEKDLIQCYPKTSTEPASPILDQTTTGGRER